jgi:putative addiction module CopG family antidote
LTNALRGIHNWRFLTMAYQFPPDLDEAIRERMSSGRYSSEDDVLREALRALRWQDQEIAAIREGIEDMEAGRTKPLREFDRDFRKRNNIAQDA